MAHYLVWAHKHPRYYPKLDELCIPRVVEKISIGIFGRYIDLYCLLVTSITPLGRCTPDFTTTPSIWQIIQVPLWSPGGGILGHIVSGKVVSMDQNKVKAVLDWKIPTTAKQLHGLLGLTRYYH